MAAFSAPATQGSQCSQTLEPTSGSSRTAQRPSEARRVPPNACPARAGSPEGSALWPRGARNGTVAGSGGSYARSSWSGGTVQARAYRQPAGRGAAPPAGKRVRAQRAHPRPWRGAAWRGCGVARARWLCSLAGCIGRVEAPRGLLARNAAEGHASGPGLPRPFRRAEQPGGCEGRPNRVALLLRRGERPTRGGGFAAAGLPGSVLCRLARSPMRGRRVMAGVGRG